MGMFYNQAFDRLMSPELEAKIDLVLENMAGVVSELRASGFRVELDYSKPDSVVRLIISKSRSLDRIYQSTCAQFVGHVKKVK